MEQYHDPALWWDALFFAEKCRGQIHSVQWGSEGGAQRAPGRPRKIPCCGADTESPPGRIESRRMEGFRDPQLGGDAAGSLTILSITHSSLGTLCALPTHPGADPYFCPRIRLNCAACS